MYTEHHFSPGGNACRGCGSMLSGHLAMDAIYATSKDALVFGSTCGMGNSEMPTHAGEGLHAAEMAGIEMVLKLKRHPEKKLVLITGEGQVFDMAFDTFSGAFSRGQQITFVVVDNQGLASSGAHQTSTTPLGVRTPIHPFGKVRPQKNVALMMIFNQPAYVATASPAFPDDLQRKVSLAVQHQPSLVQIFCPCITNWGTEPKMTIRLSRLAATNGMFPLWEFKDGVFRQTVKPRQREHVRAFLDLQRRYRGTDDETVGRIDAQAAALSEIVENMERVFSGEKR